jgi:glycosyltransferase involved in cell wall biosynthesis
MAISRLLRVLHIITQSRPFGGAQQNTLSLLTRVNRERFHNHLACGPRGPLIDAARDAGIPVTVVPTLDNPLHPVADARALASMVRLCRAGRFDIVHTHSTKAGALGRLAAALCRTPVVVHTIHAVPFDEFQRPAIRVAALWAERLAARWCDRLVSIGDTLADDFARARICPRDKIVTIRSGIDFSRLEVAADRVEVRRRLGIGPREPVVGSVGHMREAKGYPYLLEAASAVRQRFSDLRLVIIGDGPVWEQVKQRARQLELSDCCLFLGRREDVPALLRAMDLYAQASLWEGIPRAIQEAMYVGLPVVATDVNGTSEVVAHGVTGILVPPRDVAALAQAIGDLLADRAAAARLGAAGRRKMSDEFSVERTVQRTEKLYLELVGRDRGSVVSGIGGRARRSRGKSRLAPYSSLRT